MLFHIIVTLFLLKILSLHLFLFYQHQQQVAAAVERAKQVTMSELNAIVGVSKFFCYGTLKYISIFVGFFFLNNFLKF